MSETITVPISGSVAHPKFNAVRSVIHWEEEPTSRRSYVSLASISARALTDLRVKTGGPPSSVSMSFTPLLLPEIGAGRTRESIDRYGQASDGLSRNCGQK